MSSEDIQGQPADPVPLLAPGSRVFVVLHKDPLRERIDVRVSRILHLEDDVLFLAQTEPPVPRDLSGALLEVAVLTPDATGAMRPLGYEARLLDVREEYPLEDRVTVTAALAVSAPGPADFFETSLRMHYRVPVDEDMGIIIRLEGFEGVELLDFSAGGARVRVLPGAQAPRSDGARRCDSGAAQASEADGAHAPGPDEAQTEPCLVQAFLPGVAHAEETGGPSFAVGQSIPFRLLFLGSGYAEGDGVVRSVTPDEDGQRVTLGLFFTNMEIRDIRYLERMVARTVSTSRQRERDAAYI